MMPNMPGYSDVIQAKMGIPFFELRSQYAINSVCKLFGIPCLHTGLQKQASVVSVFRNARMQFSFSACNFFQDSTRKLFLCVRYNVFPYNKFSYRDTCMHEISQELHAYTLSLYNVYLYVDIGYY